MRDHGRVLGATGLAWLVTFGVACAVVPPRPVARLRDAAVTQPAERKWTTASFVPRPTAARNQGAVERARYGATRESAAAHAEAAAGSTQHRPSRVSHATRLVGRSGAVLAARADASLTD
jgi:hypothetical protein